jgi:hypothetical protein
VPPFGILRSPEPKPRDPSSPDVTLSGQRESADREILSVDGVQRGKPIAEV